MSAELHVLVGAYALDALEDREQVAFEAHLDGCLRFIPLGPSRGGISGRSGRSEVVTVV